MANIDDIQLLCCGVKAWNARRKDTGFKPMLTHLDIRNADLRGANFSGVDFDGTRMSNVDLRGAEFVKAHLNGVRITRANFKEANMLGVELKGADFSHVSFHNTILDNAVGLDLKVRHGDLSEIHMHKARLEMTHFYNCDLTGANFHGIELPSSLLKRVVIDDANCYEIEKAGAQIHLVNQPHLNEWINWDEFSVKSDDAEFGVIIHEGRAYWIADGRWDFFISHASEDKDHVARPLAQALQSLNQRVWFDELSIKAGDSLEEVISHGTQASVHGIVIVSPRFFGRRWTETELSALEQKRMFLVLCDMDAEELAEIRPSLAKRFCLSSDIGSEALAKALVDAAQRPL